MDLLEPYGLSGVDEAIISGNIRFGRSHSHYWKSRFRWDTYLWRENGKAYDIKGN